MNLDDFVQPIVMFVKTHESWAAPIAFLVAFGESFAFFSLLWPGTAILVGISALLAASGMELSALMPAIVGAALGGSLGYAASYWIGLYFKDSIASIWPFSRNPDLIPQGKAFFDRYGAFGVFMGHFFGPVRAVIPVVAGMFAMPQWAFQLANITSAIIWSAGVIAPAFFLVTFKEQIFQVMREHDGIVAALMFGLGLFNSIPHTMLAVPTLVAFVGVGALHLFAGGHLMPIWLAGALGAFLGDQIAYRIGSGLKERKDAFYIGIDRKVLVRARSLLRRWGGAMLLPAKFSAGWRASVPLTAGLTRQAMLPFVAWSVVAAVVWAGVLLTPRLIARAFGY